MRSKITLKELAKILNVSVSTVSKALNDSPEISQKTIQRVKELARLHNYKPNPTAVNLKRKRTGNIAVIVPNISNSFFSKALGGVETAARELGLQVITYISNESLKLEQQIVDLLSHGTVDGLMISLSQETQEVGDYDHIYRLLEYEIPVVLFDRIGVGLDLDKVGVNDRGSIYNAVKFLYSQGIKKIGLICSMGDVGLGRERIEGYQKACNDYNLGVDDSYLLVSKDSDELKSKLTNLLKEKEVDALIGVDYLSTLLASRVVQENGFKIPEDVKLLGYVNEDFANFLWPSVSYIDQHPVQIGATAAGLLSDRITGYSQKPPVKKIVETQLVHLESTRV